MLDDAVLSDVANEIANASDPRLAATHLLRELATALQASARCGNEGRREHGQLARELSRFAEQLSDHDHAPRTLREQLEAFREQLIHEAMAKARNNVTRAARELGVSRNLIYSVAARAKQP